MNKIIDALKLAENTLRDIIRVYKFETGTPVTALAAIREARAEQEKQQPVVYRVWHRMGGISYRSTKPSETEYVEWDALYAAPVQQVELTVSDLDAIIEKHYDDEMDLKAMILDGIAAFKDKNK